jgi:hypothetical protein
LRLTEINCPAASNTWRSTSLVVPPGQVSLITSVLPSRRIATTRPSGRVRWMVRPRAS